MTMALLLVPMTSLAQAPNAFDPAAAFGARQGVLGLRLSPDGKSVSYIGPAAGQGGFLYTLDLAPGSKAHIAARASGNPERLQSCQWVSNDRLVCGIYFVEKDSAVSILTVTREIAVDRTGANFKLLSTSGNTYTRGFSGYGGSVIDWLPDEDGSVLMTRSYLPDDHSGSHIGTSKIGFGVDHVNTRSLQIVQLEVPRAEALQYISDGRGTVRIMERASTIIGDQDSGIYRYFYRKQNARDWEPLSQFNAVDGSGFRPYAIDYDLNIAYGLKKLDGRLAAYSVALDGSLSEALLYSNPDVDVSGFISIGRRNRVVGVSYSTDYTNVFYFDSNIESLMKSLSKALPESRQISIVDASADEQVLLIFAANDDDPGLYYVFDRRSKQLRTFLVVRSELEGVRLANVRSIEYPAADGIKVPGYLTLPPGAASMKGLPAIVMPHGGPNARDYWGFDWLSQFYAAMGFVVLKPNFRGSAGYGDTWTQQNAFKSWRVAIGDVLDAGRWLIAQGVDPDKLCIVGWSYGGYAALQSAVTDPSVFKAVVAIAPVTDFDMAKEEWHRFSNFKLISDEIGEGANAREGSPARHADQIKVPVLLFHGALDRNVRIAQSELMASKLTAARVKNELVTWDNLDHRLEDSAARTQMLRKSAEFLKAATDK
jgi:dienelactone hydrolase